MSWPEVGVIGCIALWLGSTTAVIVAARRRRRRLWGSVLWAALVFVLDPLVLGLGVLVALSSLFLLAVASVGTLLAWRRRDDEAKKLGAMRCFLLSATGILGVALVALNFRVAAERGQRVVDSLVAYRAVNGELPATLGALSPRHIEPIPSVRMLLIHQPFLYDRNRAELAYVVGPLMGRVYEFRTSAWRPLDD